MTTCLVQVSGTIELYFYDELDPRTRDETARHLAGCAECQRALEELTVIRDALAARPDVSAPPGGDWSGFMARLETAVAREAAAEAPVASAAPVGWRPSSAWVTMAALLALVSLAVALVMRSRAALTVDPSAPAIGRAAGGAEVMPVAGGEAPRGSGWSPDAAFASLAEEHFERSKLVLLGLTSREPEAVGSREWAYERELASTLLGDTRVYRMAAEEHGLTSVADVMGDLELVLLQTSMSPNPDPVALEQIQRLIRKRDLVTRMNVMRVANR